MTADRPNNVIIINYRYARFNRPIGFFGEKFDKNAPTNAAGFPGRRFIVSIPTLKQRRIEPAETPDFYNGTIITEVFYSSSRIRFFFCFRTLFISNRDYFSNLAPTIYIYIYSIVSIDLRT